MRGLRSKKCRLDGWGIWAVLVQDDKQASALKRSKYREKGQTGMQVKGMGVLGFE